MRQNCKNLADVAAAAAEAEGFLGTGTEPKTFAPLVFVVFKTDELILQFSAPHIMRFVTHILWQEKRERYG